MSAYEGSKMQEQDEHNKKFGDLNKVLKNDSSNVLSEKTSKEAKYKIAIQKALAIQDDEANYTMSPLKMLTEVNFILHDALKN